MTKSSNLILFLAVTVGLLTTRATAQPRPDSSRVPAAGSVMVQIYSGRPNPTFQPGDKDFAHVLAMIDHLPIGNEEKGLPDNLGYTGFFLMLGERRAIRLYRDTIEIRTWTTEPRGSTAIYKRDDAKSVEAELIRLAEKSGVLNKDIKAEIESGKDVRRPKNK